MEAKKTVTPQSVFSEYERGRSVKAGIGAKGLYEQSRINERFYVGDQWYGAQCGAERPLVRHNVIRRIGDYKIAVVAGSPISVQYSAEGVPDTTALRDRAVDEKARLAQQQAFPDEAGEETTPIDRSTVLSALTDYFRVTAERVRFDELREQILRNAYISGTGVLYTWWDDRIPTGLYADDRKIVPIQGDLACDVLDIENVYFGDPGQYGIEEQPYILLVQRKSVEELRRMARQNRRPAAEMEAIKPDHDTQYMAGDRAADEPLDAKKATVITRLWKEYDEEGGSRVKAAIFTQEAVIRPEWDTRLRRYPIARFCWERRRNSAYGESEVTYLIPNQIAINRMLTSSVWAVMMLGMPITVVNTDVVQQPVTNDPGQILQVAGTAEDVSRAIFYLPPPNFSPAFDNNISSLIQNTLTQSGANDAALGDIRPDNTSAIIAVREAATMPLQTVQSRFYAFIEEVARIWAEFWTAMYGKRPLKIEDENGTWYLPFDGEAFRDTLFHVRVDVGASNLWSEIQSIHTLDNLLDRQIITVDQYLERLPKGTIPDVSGLIRDLRTAQAAPMPAATEQSQADPGASPDGREGMDPMVGQGEAGGGVSALLAELPPEKRAAFEAAPTEVKRAILKAALG